MDAAGEASRSGHSITVQWEGEPKQWRALLAGVEQVNAMDGGVAENSDKGTLITPSNSATSLMITLER